MSAGTILQYPLVFHHQPQQQEIPFPVATTPQVMELLAANAIVAIGVSGGKDSAATVHRLDDYFHPGDSKSFSKAVIESVNSDLGSVHILLIRRGTSKRWETSIGSKRFAELVGLTGEKSDQQRLFAGVSPYNDLFACQT